MAEKPVAAVIGARDAAGVNMHAGQLAVSAGVVRELVTGQFPGWRQLATTKIDAEGTVNAIFRD